MKQGWRIGIIIMLLLAPVLAAIGHGQEAQNVDRRYDELMTIYLGNLARRAAGIPPLRANVQLTHAARWFAWDTVTNRTEPYCGHEDSQGGAFYVRAATFGYRGFAGGENCFCGYVSPADAIAGWLNSGGHRENLLNPRHREIGLGYYQDAERGYIAQIFGYDSTYSPVIIENEALATENPQVGLYIYGTTAAGDLMSIGTPIEMQISNNPLFTNAPWEPYTAEKTWTLEPGTGWRTVYVKTRDRLQRTVTVSDTIYLGADLPREQLNDGLLSSTRPDVTIVETDQSGWPQVQFSLGWLADDSFDQFKLWWGNGESVQDPGAIGGSAFRLFPGNGESFAWFSTTSFIQDQPLVAYFRIKTSDNSSPKEVARLLVKGGGVEYGPLSLPGTAFQRPGEYQEFAIPFTFHNAPETEFDFLQFNIWRSGNADIVFDTVTIFTAPQPVSATITWTLPNGNYRGQGIQARYSDSAGGFSKILQTKVDANGIVHPLTTESLVLLPLVQ